MPRAEQYTKNESDLYVSGFAEDSLDEGNPFQQNAADEPIADPDEAAVAAILSRDEKGALNAKDGSGSQDEPEKQSQPPSTNIFSSKEESAVSTELDVEPETNIDLADPLERRISSSKRPRGLVGDAFGDAVEEPDPEVGRLVKRARRDSHAVMIESGDDTKEEERKMRANVDVRDAEGEDDGNADDEGEPRQIAEDDFDRPTEVAPMPLMEKISEHKEHEPVERDAADQDDDIETKGGDDYDVENYAEFEDDDDDMEGPVKDTVGDGELIIDEDELR
jgi:hypothetical protein